MCLLITIYHWSETFQPEVLLSTYYTQARFLIRIHVFLVFRGSAQEPIYSYKKISLTSADLWCREDLRRAACKLHAFRECFVVIRHAGCYF